MASERDVAAVAEVLEALDGADYAHLAAALLDSPAMHAIIAAAEQRGREDAEGHGTCYQHGSRALAARLAEAWDEGHELLCDDIPHWCRDLHLSRNPYRADAEETGAS